MSEIAAKTRLVLASRSPRRRDIIKALGLPVEVASPGGEEGLPRPDETPAEFVVRLSRQKVRRVADEINGAGPVPDGVVVLGADTAVVLDGDVLGKPASADEATRMLRALRGAAHTVVTGVTIWQAALDRRLSAAKTSSVTMRDYSDAELAAYVDSGEPFDKAGAYGVQDSGFRPAAAVEGCYLNVVGLPLCEVTELLAEVAPDTRLRPSWQPPAECRDCPLDS